jgi:hypothetical protein
MQSNVITNAHDDTPVTVNLNPNDMQARDWQFLRDWSNKQKVSLEVLLKRILIAAIKAQLGQLYAEDTTEV